jgi:hypothetical protein
MKPSELGAITVREELERLINNYPERMGSVVGSDYDDSTTCVYFTDQDDVPVSFPAYQVEGDLDELVKGIALKTPVCIIGQWIESFHPEFKEDSVIREVLFRNATMRHADTPFTDDVKLLLTRAQDQQDLGYSWQNIDLDKSDDW